MIGRKPKKPKVYVLECEGHYKVGVSLNPRSRITSLQIGCPFPIKLVMTITHPNADRLEARLHQLYRRHRVRGEWYALSPDHLRVLADRYKGKCAPALLALFEEIQSKYDEFSGCPRPQPSAV